MIHRTRPDGVGLQLVVTGRVLQVSLKPEIAGERGLPKRAVPSAPVTPAGLVGDFNLWRSRNKPGDRDQAVLVIARETLRRLQSEGWPVQPGDLGENLTVEGIPEAWYAAGRRFRVGREVEIELTEAAEPCKNLSLLPYVGEARVAEFVKATLGRRGWYARVHVAGTVCPDDEVVGLPR